MRALLCVLCFASLCLTGIAQTNHTCGINCAHGEWFSYSVLTLIGGRCDTDDNGADRCLCRVGWTGIDCTARKVSQLFF
jgi:hypothetical protein